MPKDIVPVTFTTYKIDISHARRAGERWSMCGKYVMISFRHPESIVPVAMLCPTCSSIMRGEMKKNADSS